MQAACSHGGPGSCENWCSRARGVDVGEKEFLQEEGMWFPKGEGGAHRFPEDKVSVGDVLTHS